MNALHTFTSLKNIVTLGMSTMVILSCGSFQGASYFESDGIYTSHNEIRQIPNATAQQSSKSDYYSSYFKNAADGYLDVADDDLYFTDSEGYTSDYAAENTSVWVQNSQIPWGGQTTQTEIIFMDTRPNYWGLSGFAFMNSPFWNSYYANPYRFGYGPYASFYNPYRNRFFGYNSYWDFYDPFYSPFGYAGFYGGFYGGYSGYGWNFGYAGYNPYRLNRYHNRNHYNNQRWNGDKDYRNTVARVQSGRGEKNYDKPKRNRENKDSRQSVNNSADIQSTLNRINMWRGFTSLGRNVQILNNRQNVLGSKTISGNSRTTRPIYNAPNVQGTNRTSTSPSKSVQGNTGRFTQSRYNLGARNISTPSTRTNSSLQRNITNTRIIQNNSSRIRNSNQSFSKPNYNSSPQRSYTPAPTRSMSTSRGSVSRGRSSSGGRRNP
jgi:hypothetical protein